jgi:hypothetical protein
MQVMDRRSDTRASVSLMGAVVIENDEAPAVLVDLSATGVAIQMDAPPNLDCDYRIFFNAHRTAYSLRFRVVHWTGSEGFYRWGCAFSDLADDQRESLRRTVAAASGASQTYVRPWIEVVAAADQAPEAKILVGSAPSGREITLLGRDCLDMGEDGVLLFVQTVAGIESA